MSENIKNEIGSPRKISPENFASAIPSTRLCEKDTIKRDTIRLIILESMQVTSSINMFHRVNDNKQIRIAEAKNDNAAGNTNLDTIYPRLLTGVIAM